MRPERLELPTPSFVGWCSIQLSYRREKRVGCDLDYNEFLIKCGEPQNRCNSGSGQDGGGFGFRQRCDGSLTPVCRNARHRSCCSGFLGQSRGSSVREVRLRQEPCLKRADSGNFNIVRHSACARRPHVNLACISANPTSADRPVCKSFQRFKIGKQGAKTNVDEVARNGALSRINFGQRFSWAPLAFSLL